MLMRTALVVACLDRVVECMTSSFVRPADCRYHFTWGSPRFQESTRNIPVTLVGSSLVGAPRSRHFSVLLSSTSEGGIAVDVTHMYMHPEQHRAMLDCTVMLCPEV